jgi:uncharacterized OB-fold protein
MIRDSDWTGGVEAIRYQRCDACGHLQYFRRDFCAACGKGDPAELTASGDGVVYAASLVHRAATLETRAHVQEGFRIMAHGATMLAIGDPVRVSYRSFAGHIVPYVESKPS